MLREPAVAGSFYEKDAPALRKHLARYITEKPNKIRAKAIVVPHAGYIYSGQVAGEVYSSIEIPDIIILLGPNHTGEGVPVSVMNTRIRETAGGHVQAVGAQADTGTLCRIRHQFFFLGGLFAFCRLG